MKARLRDLSFGVDGKQILSLTIEGDFREKWDDLKEKDLEVDIKKYRKKRSLDANALSWVLLDKLSAKLGLPKEEIYREYIRNIGGVSETVCVKNSAVERLCDGWGTNGIGWQTETFPSKIEGCTNVILYYGSSTYDTEQMSRLIDQIVQDCKQLGIDTATPEEIEAIMRLWENEKHHTKRS